MHVISENTSESIQCAVFVNKTLPNWFSRRTKKEKDVKEQEKERLKNYNPTTEIKSLLRLALN